MPMTRDRARSSFTFEIKRASRPTPEVLARRKSSFFAGSPLAHQVFGKFSEPSSAPEFNRPGSPSAGDKAGSGPLGITSRETVEKTEPPRQPSPRRVLPDLHSSPPNPVEERLRREAEERAARRRAARSARVAVGQGASTETAPAKRAVEQLHRDATADCSGMPGNEQASASERVARDLDLAVSLPEPTSAPFKPSANLKAAARRAQKKGLPTPRLPAGERWKRRLSWTCW
jgi:hypothetical protein